MYAIEFEADIENGIVQIPQKYQELQKKKHAKIFVLIDNEKKITKKTINKIKLSSISIETLGKKFTREDANER